MSIIVKFFRGKAAIFSGSLDIKKILLNRRNRISQHFGPDMIPNRFFHCFEILKFHYERKLSILSKIIAREKTFYRILHIEPGTNHRFKILRIIKMIFRTLYRVIFYLSASWEDFCAIYFGLTLKSSNVPKTTYMIQCYTSWI